MTTFVAFKHLGDTEQLTEEAVVSSLEDGLKVGIFCRKIDGEWMPMYVMARGSSDARAVPDCFALSDEAIFALDHAMEIDNSVHIVDVEENDAEEE